MSAEVHRLGGQDPDSAALVSIEAEQQVLGAVLIDNSRAGHVVMAGGAELFHEPIHAQIFTRIAALGRDDMLASPVTLREWFSAIPGAAELGGSAYLARLAAAAISSGMIGQYCDHLSELASRRRMVLAIDAARRSVTAGEEPAAHIAARLEAALFALDGGTMPKPVSMLKATTQAVEQAWGAHNGDVGPFVPTGIGALDRYLIGMFHGDLVLLGGRPSMGKTAVAINIALNAARADKKVAFCSLEMGADAIANRCVSEAMAGMGKAVSYRDLRAGNFGDMHHEALARAAQEVSQLPVQFLPQEFSDVGAMLAGIRRAKAGLGGLDLIVVDYVQLMRAAQAKSRYEIITEVSTALKRLARQLNVPVLALSQLSRQVEQREDKRPQMADLRESGQLEQDADTVLFCYRDEYYLEREKPTDADDLEEWEDVMRAAHNRLEIIVAKQRQGPIGTAEVKCNVALNRIWEPER